MARINRILITGAAGMVGSYVQEVFNGINLTLTDIRGDLTHLDVRDPQVVMSAIKEDSPDVVLHLAAETDVDLCEKDPDLSYHTNAIGTQNVALACQAMNCIMVYISTAGVFWGDKQTPYTEFDIPRPANVYGKSKLAGEQIITSLLNRYYIVRAGWMIGGGKKDKKFVGFITRRIINSDRHLKIVNDKFGSPTYAKDLLCGIKNLLSTGYYGLYHMVNNGSTSRYEIALALCEIIERSDIKIEPVSSAYFPLPAPRARSESMRNLKLDLLGLNIMRSWEIALSDYVLNELVPEINKQS